MEEIDPESLAEVAYGLFEIYLNRELRLRGPYLFELVGQGGLISRPTSARSSGDSGTTTLNLPMRSSAGSAGSMRSMRPSGMVKVSSPLEDDPDVLDRPGRSRPFGAGGPRRRPGGGKWLIFAPADEVDEAWRKIRDETVKGTLGISAKVSTAKPNPDSRDERSVIYVYTRDWADEADVMRVRERLRELGFTERIGYKRNIETYRGEYSEEGRKVTYYSA